MYIRLYFTETETSLKIHFFGCISVCNLFQSSKEADFNMAGVASTLSKNVKSYQNQDYGKLLDQCLSKGQLFSDPCFPAAPESLGAKKLDKGVEWKRPGVSGTFN